MADETKVLTEDERDERLVQKFMATPLMSHLSKKYGAECSQPMAAMPSASNTFVPSMDGDKPSAESLRMQRDQEAIRFARYEQENAELRKQLNEHAVRFQRAERERDLIQLEAEGYEFDRVAMLDSVQTMTAEQFAKHTETVRKFYRKNDNPIMNQPFVRVAPNADPASVATVHNRLNGVAGGGRRAGGAKAYSKEVVQMALSICTDDPKKTYPVALEEAAKVFNPA